MANSDRISDYRDLNNWSYNLGEPDISKHAKIPDGWALKEPPSFIKESEFGAAIFENKITKEVVVVFRGTDPGKARDQFTNAELFAPGRKPIEYEMAERYVEKALAEMPPDYKMRITGHSQGAGMAHYMGLKHDVPSVGFNTSPGNIYLNNIYDTLPENGKASHVDFRSSENGTKGTPVLNSDGISSAETPITNPAAPLFGPLVPGMQAYMDPIAKIEPIYLKTGCKDALCHSLTNFDDPELQSAREAYGKDFLPAEAIVGGEDKFNACFETLDKSLGDAILDEIEDEIGKVKDAVNGAAGAVANKVEDAWDTIKETASEAWDATKDIASDAWTATKDAAKDLMDDVFGPDATAGGAAPTVGPLGLASDVSNTAGGGVSQSITAMEDEADDLAQQADSHADAAEIDAGKAKAAALRAAAIAARIRAMLSRRYC